MQLTEILDRLLLEMNLQNHNAATDNLAKAIENKKYDLQDQALIEAIIDDDEEQLINSLKENYREMIKYFEEKNGSVTDTDPDIISVEIVSIFVKNLEYYIDYFYNSLLNKHFTSG